MLTNEPYLHPYDINITRSRFYDFVKDTNLKLNDNLNAVVLSKLQAEPIITYIEYEQVNHSLDKYKVLMTVFYPNVGQALPPKEAGVLLLEPGMNYTIIEMVSFDERLRPFWEELRQFLGRPASDD